MLNTLTANISVAVDHSVDVSIFVQYLAQWTYNNLANKRHFHDGFFWTFNSHEALKKYFPYWSSDQIKRVIKKAIDEGLVQKRNYNKTKYDRTCWYALTDVGLRYYPELTISENAIEQSTSDMAESPNGKDGIAEPIPTTNTTSKDLKKDINKKTLISKKDSCLPSLKKLNSQDKETMEMMLADNPHDIPVQMLLDCLYVRKKKKSLVTKTAWDMINSALHSIELLHKISPHTAFATMVNGSWLSLDPNILRKKKARTITARK